LKKKEIMIKCFFGRNVLSIFFNAVDEEYREHPVVELLSSFLAVVLSFLVVDP
jgi:hypothetical protein